MDESHKILMSESIPPWNVNCSVFGLLANSQWAPITQSRNTQSIPPRKNELWYFEPISNPLSGYKNTQGDLVHAIYAFYGSIKNILFM